jgi:hypothetical protein
MKAKAINVHNSDDRWDLHTVQTACRQRERQLKWKYISKKKIPADELWASLFFIGEGRHYKRIWIIPKNNNKKQKKTGTQGTNQFERTIDGRA